MWARSHKQVKLIRCKFSLAPLYSGLSLTHMEIVHGPAIHFYIWYGICSIHVNFWVAPGLLFCTLSHYNQSCVVLILFCLSPAIQVYRIKLMLQVEL
jgi:hypothetical protein